MENQKRMNKLRLQSKQRTAALPSDIHTRAKHYLNSLYLEWIIAFGTLV